MQSLTLKLIIHLLMKEKLASSKSKHRKYQKSGRSISMGNAFYRFDVNEKVNLLNKNIKNILLNYIPHETFNL